VVHGVLHLLGMDHAVDAEANGWSVLERTLLARYHQPTRIRAGRPGRRRDAGADGGTRPRRDRRQRFRSVDALLIALIVVLLLVVGLLALAETSLVRTSRVEGQGPPSTTGVGEPASWCAWSNTRAILEPGPAPLLICQLVSATWSDVRCMAGGHRVEGRPSFEVVVSSSSSRRVPKNWAVHNPSALALFSAPIVAAIVRFPLVRAVSSVLIGWPTS